MKVGSHSLTKNIKKKYIYNINMGIICSNHKPAKPNNEDFTVPLRWIKKLFISDGRKVHNNYYFVTKFINPQTYKNREIDID